jgi:thiamine transport system substrate-binding protein
VIPQGSKLFRQVEGAAVLKGAKHAELGRKFIDFLLSDAFQKQIPETMFVYSAIPNLPAPDWWRWAEVDVQPADLTVDAATVDRWISEWTDIMRR